MHHRRLPGPALEPFVAHYWTVTWDLASPFKAETLPHPSVHIVFEGQAGRQRTEVAGVHTARFTKQLVGRGQAFGIKFRPGMFKPLWGKSLATLANIPARAIFGARAALWTRQTFAAETFDDQIALSEAFLAPRLSTIPALALRVRDLAELISKMTGATIANLPNPRREAVENDLIVSRDKFLALGLDPVYLSEGLLEEARDIALKYADRADVTKIIARSVWRKGMETSPDLMEG